MSNPKTEDEAKATMKRTFQPVPESWKDQIHRLDWQQQTSISFAERHRHPTESPSGPCHVVLEDDDDELMLNVLRCHLTY